MTRRAAEILLDAHARDVAETLAAAPATDRPQLLAWFMASVAEQVERQAA